MPARSEHYRKEQRLSTRVAGTTMVSKAEGLDRELRERAGAKIGDNIDY
jgi:hypothetical protein